MNYENVTTHDPPPSNGVIFYAIQYDYEVKFLLRHNRFRDILRVTVKKFVLFYLFRIIYIDINPVSKTISCPGQNQIFFYFFFFFYLSFTKSFSAFLHKNC